mmetsp:Transcript_1594/g.1756  ORF Transcript_1594/g.1756 Transcript_1594/m.1756 type:complete len:217 (-) Transcript_1594:106-756(-)
MLQNMNILFLHLEFLACLLYLLEPPAKALLGVCTTKKLLGSKFCRKIFSVSATTARSYAPSSICESIIHAASSMKSLAGIGDDLVELLVLYVDGGELPFNDDSLQFLRVLRNVRVVPFCCEPSITSDPLSCFCITSSSSISSSQFVRVLRNVRVVPFCCEPSITSDPFSCFCITSSLISSEPKKNYEAIQHKILRASASTIQKQLKNLSSTQNIIQ